MKNKFTLLPFLVLALGAQVTLAQVPNNGSSGSTPIAGTTVARGNSKITGTVVDATNQNPVGFATITLTDAKTGKAVDGALADEKGKFTMPKIGPGNYRVVVSFIGYETRNIENVRINDRNDDVILGDVKINISATALKEVQVQGQRAMFEEKVDRTVYNAENDASNRGGDASDVLRKVPMLSVDLDGNVTMRGSSNLRVLINNRPSTITAGSVADALKQIPADLIKSVEVITSPSAKYDAEGSAGIINIVLKKNNLQGGNLNIDAGAGLRGSNLGLNGSYRKGKMGFSLGGFGRAMYNTTGSFENSQIAKDLSGTILSTTIQQADTRQNNIFGRYTFGWDYDINKNNFISSSVQYGIRNGNSFQDGLLTQRYQNDNLLNRGLRNVESTDNSGTVDVNLNYTHTFAKPQQEFSILTQFSRNNQTSNFVNAIFNNDLTTLNSRLKNINESFNQESTVQLDYQSPIGKNQMVELGGKQIMRQVISDYETYTAAATGQYTRSTDQSLSNIFNYNQNVSAGYLSYTLTTPSQFSFKSGVRYEYTNINADFEKAQNGSEILIPSYGVLVPSVNLSQRLKSGNTVKLSYNRRIQRPSLQFLNPNRQAANPLNVTIGNPNLDPEYTNNFEVAYNTFINKTSLNFSAYVRNTNNAIQSIRDITDNILRTTYENIGQENAYGLSVFGSVNISNKLTFNGGTDVFYSTLENNNTNPIYRASNEGFVYNMRGMGSYILGNGWGLQGFAFYRGRQVQLQGTQGGFGIYSLNLRKDIFNKKGTLGFGAENFFGTSITMRNELYSPILEQRSTNVRNNLSFRATFSYRLGKITAEPTRRRKKSVNNDDMKSGGGDGGQDAAAAPQGGGNAPAGGGAGMGAGQRPAGVSGQMPTGGAGQMRQPVANPAQQPVANPTPDSTAVTTPGQVTGDATGTWVGRLGQFDLTLKLVSNGENLSGTVITPRGEMPISEGKFLNNDITFNVLFGNNVVPYRGKLNGDSININTNFQGQNIEAVFNRSK